jgi:hypothetical protein
LGVTPRSSTPINEAIKYGLFSVLVVTNPFSAARLSLAIIKSASLGVKTFFPKLIRICITSILVEGGITGGAKLPRGFAGDVPFTATVSPQPPRCNPRDSAVSLSELLGSVQFFYSSGPRCAV